MSSSIDFYGRFLITFGIALQLLQMKFAKSANVYPMAFYLYGFGCYMVSYNYYITGRSCTALVCKYILTPAHRQNSTNHWNEKVTVQ